MPKYGFNKKVIKIIRRNLYSLTKEHTGTNIPFSQMGSLNPIQI